jgi:hypothetical protein
VAEGEVVGTAVIFHGPARIDGTVTETLVVFDGRTEISGTVEGDVVVFNGEVTVRSGATIAGDLVTRATPTVESGATLGGQQRGISANLDAGDFGLVGRFLWWIGYTFSTLILGLLLLLTAPAIDHAILRAAREKTGASIGLGVLTFFLLPVVAVLLIVIVVTIPLGLFLLLALALLYTVGFVAAAHGLGRLLVKPPVSRFLAFLAGWGILRAIALVPFLGGAVWLLGSIFGLGLLMVAAHDARGQAPAGTVPPPPPLPVVE